MTFGVGVPTEEVRQSLSLKGLHCFWMGGGVLTTKVSLLSKIGLPVSPR